VLITVGVVLLTAFGSSEVSLTTGVSARSTVPIR